MIIYSPKPNRRILFEAPTSSYQPHSIETNDKSIDIFEFSEEYKGIFVLQINNKETGNIDSIYSSVPLKIKEGNPPQLDIYEF